jgi:GntR family transcriptional regulator
MVIGIDFRSGIPVPRQIADAILLRTLSGALPAGSRLPGVRELSLQLQINPNSVDEAYLILEDAGVATRTGDGWAVSADLPASDAAFVPLSRSMGVVIERGLRIGLSPEDLSAIFRRALEATYGSP